MTNTKTAKVATHTVKKAKITFGLVTIESKLMSAAREEGSGLKMVVKTEDGSILQASQMYTAGGKTYSYQDVGRAIEVGDGKFLWIDKAEIDACKAKSTEEIKITNFVPLSQVDPVFFDSSYFIAPDPGKHKDVNAQSIRMYGLLLDVMKEVGLVALAKVEFKGKEHNAVIRVYTDGTQDFLMLHTIYTSSDIRTANIMRPTVAADAPLKAAALDLVKQMTTSFDPTSVVSESDAIFEALVAGKKQEAAGGSPFNGVPTPSSTASTVDPLMAALTASLHKVGVNTAPAEAPTATPKKASKKATK